MNGQRAIVIFSDVFLGAISRKFGQGKGDCISWVIKLNVIFFPVTLGVNLKDGSCLEVRQSLESSKRRVLIRQEVFEADLVSLLI